MQIALEEEIQRLAPTIWESILRLPLSPAAEAAPSGERIVSACVHITGAWNGVVTLNCSVEFGSRAARIMFNSEEEKPATADIQDALGELANMMGGNIKGLLPEMCHLSLPAVVEGADYSVRFPGARLLTSIPFRCGEYPLTVSLHQREVRKAA
jgi:chemotaxis protein CheX